MIGGDDLAALVGRTLEPRPLLRLGGVNWRPDWGSASDELVAVHFAETGEVGESIRKRITGARDAGFRVVVVVPHRGTGFSPDSQVFLLDTPTELIAIDEQATHFASYAELVITEGLILESSAAGKATTAALEHAAEAPRDEKGKLLETAIALAQSQVPGWVIYERNLRTRNEELDVVVENNSARAPWNGTPYIVSECKNWTEPVGREEYDSLHMKLKERGGFARLGFALAMNGFSSGFYERAKSFGTHDMSIVPISVPWLVSRLQSGQAIEDILSARVRDVVFDRQWEEPD